MYSRVWSFFLVRFFLCCSFFFFFVPAPLLFFYFSISSSLFIQSFFFFFCRFLVKHTNLLFFVFSLSNLFVALRWMFCVLLKPYVITCFLHFNSEMLLLLLVLFASKLRRGRENGIHCARKCWEICFVSIYFANLAPFYQQLKNIMFQFFQSIFPILFAFFNLRTARSDMNSDGIVWEIEQKEEMTREREREQMGNMHVRYISRLPHTQHTHIQRQRERDGGLETESFTAYIRGQGHWNTCVFQQQKKKKRKEKLAEASGSDLSPTLCVPLPHSYP